MICLKQKKKSNFLLYADNSCLIYQRKDITKIEKILNEDFENICDWFVNNKLSIHFGYDKTKSIFVNIRKLNIRYNQTSTSWMCIRQVNVW